MSCGDTNTFAYSCCLKHERWDSIGYWDCFATTESLLDVTGKTGSIRVGLSLLMTMDNLMSERFLASYKLYRQYEVRGDQLNVPLTRERHKLWSTLASLWHLCFKSSSTTVSDPLSSVTDFIECNNSKDTVSMQSSMLRLPVYNIWSNSNKISDMTFCLRKALAYWMQMKAGMKLNFLMIWLLRTTSERSACCSFSKIF